jgi:hypothetical protein
MFSQPRKITKFTAHSSKMVKALSPETERNATLLKCCDSAVKRCPKQVAAAVDIRWTSKFDALYTTL